MSLPVNIELMGLISQKSLGVFANERCFYSSTGQKMLLFFNWNNDDKRYIITQIVLPQFSYMVIKYTGYQKSKQKLTLSLTCTSNNISNSVVLTIIM